jgi:UDP-GlcNAc:undecaprenyl-phosphate GlcNAc-1-phosphate transferase
MMLPPIPPTLPEARVLQLSPDDVLSPNIWVFYAAFCVAFLMTPLMRRVAIYYGIVDRPDNVRKMHREPVAYLGGVAVFLGWLVGVVASQACQWHLGKDWIPALGYHVTIPLSVVIGAFLVVLLGLYDDLFAIGPRWKIAGQVLAAIILLRAGIGDSLADPFVENVAVRSTKVLPFVVSQETWASIAYWLSCGLTIGIVVFCCNASNLMDGLDGLCGGVTAIISFGLLFLAVSLALHPNLGNPESIQREALRVILALALLGATLGFVPFNFNPASIFMGDSGSLFLGFSIALLIILLGEAQARWLLAAMIMFALPVLDTALAFARRKLAGRPLFSADKQHLHHQLIARGLSTKQAVLVLYALAIFFVVCGIAIVYVRTRYAVAFYLVLFGSIIVAAYKMGMVHERVVHAKRPEIGGTGITEVPIDDDPTPIG